jgi:hypothetical protein
MKKLLSIFILVFVITSIVKSQIRVVDAESGPADDYNGLYFSLPLTVFKIDFDVIKIEKIPGPLADYTKQYLGTDDYIKKSSVTFDIGDFNLKVLTIADKSSSYYMSFNSEKFNKEKGLQPPVVVLSPEGIIRSFNIMPPQKEKLPPEHIIKEENKIIVIGNDDEMFRYNAEYNKVLNVDTIIRKITLDTMTINKFLIKTSWINKTPEERADDAAKQIDKIRESRFKLLTGYHEVNFGESIKYMDSELFKLENQYMQLFVGKEQKSVEHFTVFYTPDENSLQKVIYKSINDDQILINISVIQKNKENSVKGLLESAVLYRIPAKCNVEVTFKERNIYSDLISISQLGVTTAISTLKTGIEFNPETWEPIIIIKK